jgi:hypothetical protein
VFEQEHEKLRRQLEAHQAYGCNLNAHTQVVYQPPVTVAVKSQPVIVEAANAPYTTVPVTLAEHHQPLTKPRRPQTLGLTQHQLSADKAQIKLEEQLETPSKMIAPLFDGFTPTSIFGNIPTLNTPTCSVQQQLRGGDLTTPSDLTCSSLTAL